MKEIIYKCDGCGKQKGEVNHWYAVTLATDPERASSLGISTLTVAVKNPELAWEHFCGEECLLRMVARNLPK